MVRLIRLERDRMGRTIRRILGLRTHAKLPHGQPQTFYDIQRCEAPEQPKSRRGGAIERLLMQKGLLARRDGLYARRTP